MDRKHVRLLLLALITLDVIYPLIIFLVPGLWTELLHGQPLDDPFGLLRRLGMVWALFAVLHIVTLLKWEKDPGWLMLSAGVRWTESGSDWVYLAYAESMTLFGTAALLSATPINIVCGWLFYRSYLRYRPIPAAAASRAAPQPETTGV